MPTTNNPQERSRDMTDKGYLEALLRLQALVLAGLPLEYEDSNCIGDKYTRCSWGLCSESKEMWPEPDMHLWPDDFINNGRIAPLHRSNHHLCPCDTRTVGGNNGCFWTCIIFSRKLRKDMLGHDDMRSGEFFNKYVNLLQDRITAAKERIAQKEVCDANEHE